MEKLPQITKLILHFVDVMLKKSSNSRLNFDKNFQGKNKGLALALF